MKAISEFIDLLERVVQDGELTYSEVYDIGKWINANRSVRAEWPVNEFYKLLKGSFADGRIEKSEAIEIARLIQTVLREWSRQNTSKTTPSIKEIVATAINAYDIATPKIPSIPTQLRIPSESDEGCIYNLDYTGPTCDCPDFRSNRAMLPTGHLSRCCKHLMQGYAQLRPENGWPGWLDPYLELGIRPYPQQLWAVVPIGKLHALLSSPMKGWGNVYVRYASGNKRFGYNVLEDRWSYDTEPQSASRLEAAFRKMPRTG